MNIGVDSVAFIDDSEFERAEVLSALPQVRCYDALNMSLLIGRNEFEVPPSLESKNRRLSYKAEEIRTSILETFGGNKLDFLESCELKLMIHCDLSEDAKIRCYELLQRSNQYNLSTVRYGREEFDNFFKNEDKVYALEVSDKFGDYGIVSFARFSFTEGNFLLHDFVMSCRVAQKNLEREFLSYIISNYSVGNSLKVEAFKTQKNEPLRRELREMPFDSCYDLGDTEKFVFKKISDDPFINDKVYKIILCNGF